MTKYPLLEALLAASMLSATYSGYAKEPETPRNHSTQEAERVPCEKTSSLRSLAHKGGPGTVYIPAQAACGGDYPLLVVLHGINRAKSERVYVGGKGKLEAVAQKLYDVKKAPPVILAEMVDRSGDLYTDDFDPAAFVNDAKALLAKEGIHAKSLHVMAHSGSNCDKESGIHQFVRAVPVDGIGLSDGTCSLDYGKELVSALGSRDPTITLYTRGGFGGDQAAYRTLTHGLAAKKIPCPKSNLLCGKDPDHAWYGYVVKEKHHDKIPALLLTHMLQGMK